MDNKMIERCAKVLWQNFCPGLMPGPEDKLMYKEAIVKIIKAMHEPTEKMSSKGNLAIAVGLEADTVFKNMIDAVLND